MDFETFVDIPDSKHMNPCPVCKSAEKIRLCMYRNDSGQYRYTVMCCGCKTRIDTEYFMHWNTALDAWNSKTPEN